VSLDSSDTDVPHLKRLLLLIFIQIATDRFDLRYRNTS
jgi:hypothetical protein